MCLCLVSNYEIDEIYYLQNYKEGWTDGKWEERMDERECIEQNSFVQVSEFTTVALINHTIGCFFMSPLRRHIFVCFIAKLAFLGGFWP